MLSLGNAFSAAEVEAFFARAERGAGHVDAYVCELKIDGLAISLTYRDGALVRAPRRAATASRARTSPPTCAPSAASRCACTTPAVLPGEFEVRGEVYLPKARFAAFNAQLEEAGKPTYANPRNAAAGAVRQLDPAVTAKRGLSTFMYQLEPPPRGATSQAEVLDLLAARRLPRQPAPPRGRLASTRCSPSSSTGRRSATTSTTRPTAWSSRCRRWRSRRSSARCRARRAGRSPTSSRRRRWRPRSSTSRCRWAAPAR